MRRLPVTLSLPLALLLAVLLAMTAGCGRAPEEDVPPFVDDLISRLEAAPKSNPPGSIWRYTYEGRSVFYVPPSCCDVPGELYDDGGTLICSPDGGITGDGDGRCPDFFAVRAEEQRIWIDGR